MLKAMKRSLLGRLPSLFSWRISIFAGSFVLIGLVAVVTSHAAGPYVATEAENGTISGAATTASDATASGGQYAALDAPTPTPTGSSTCPLPAYPNPSCAGLPSGTTFTNTVNGDYTVSTGGQVIDAWHITGTLIIQAANVVIKNSQIDDHIDNEAAPSSSFTINDSTVGPTTCSTEGWPSINGHHFTANRVHLRNHQDSVDMVGDAITIADSLFQPCYQPASVVGSDGFHSDGVQDQCSATCTGITLNHDTIDARAYYGGQSWGNSALNLGSQADGLHIRSVTLKNNLFMGGSYTTDLRWDAGLSWIVTGNSWVQGAWTYAPISTESTCSNQTWGVDTASNLPNRIVVIDANYNVTSVANTTGCVD